MSGAEQRRRQPSRRRGARRLALQALYQWILSDKEPREIARQLREDASGRLDWDHFMQLFPAAAENRRILDEQLATVLDSRRLDPVEQAVLWLGAFELARLPDIPYRVIINEYVELAKDFGAADGYKYVNAVLDKVAPKLRETEDKTD